MAWNLEDLTLQLESQTSMMIVQRLQNCGASDHDPFLYIGADKIGQETSDLEQPTPTKARSETSGLMIEPGSEALPGRVAKTVVEGAGMGLTEPIQQRVQIEAARERHAFVGQRTEELSRIMKHERELYGAEPSRH